MATEMSSIIFRFSLVLVLLSATLTSTGNAVSQNVPGCDDEAKALARLCAKYVLKTDVVKLISMDKVFYVADTCGRKIPPMKKCGSIGPIRIK
ncbi:hypothetical protein MKW92_051506 [Papaver armeniacum]|nr:hypothetical protein MKW92_051506 [Papaver armeniacum]